MAEQIASKKPVVRAAPEFEVDGEDAPALGEDLLRLEVHHQEDGLSRLECDFANWGHAEPGQPPGFLHFDAGEIRLGSTLVVRAGDEDARAEVFRGRVTRVGGLFPDSQPAEFSICAEDRLQELRMSRHSRAFEDADDADIVQSVSRKHGMRADTQARGAQHRAYWQVNRSDLAVLRERAAAADAALSTDDDTLRFRPRRPSSESPVELTWFEELLSFEVSADLAHQRREVEVHGYSVADKEGIHEKADNASIRTEADGGRTGPELLDSLDFDAAEHVHVESPGTAEEARQLADALARERARRFVTGHGLTVGTPGLRVGQPLELHGVGPWFEGRYTATTVTHTFDRQQGLRTRFNAQRVDIKGQN